MHTKSEFIAEHGRLAVPFNLPGDVVGVCKRVLVDRQPALFIETEEFNIPGMSGPPDRCCLASGRVLDDSPEGWDILLRDTAGKLRELADELDRWRAGKTQDEFLTEWGLEDDDDAAD